MNIREIKEEFEDALLSLDNVIGVETGIKEKDGEEIGEESIRVIVKRKKPISELPNRMVIPKEIKGFKTDVIDNNGPIVIPPLMDEPNVSNDLDESDVKKRTQKWRPCPFGVSIGHEDITAGTQGAPFLKNDKLFTLSNNHVKANMNEAQLGDPILQPGPYDSGKNRFEELFDYIKLPEGESSCKVANSVSKLLNWIAKIFNRTTRMKPVIPSEKGEVDAAIGKPLDREQIEMRVLGHKTNDGYEDRYIRGSKKPIKSEKVWTSGRTIGFKGNKTGAKIKSTDSTVRVMYGKELVTMKNQVHIKSDNKFSAGGMSGSAICNKDKVVALLFAGSRDGKNTYGNNIKIVEDKLEGKIPDMKKVN